MEHIHTPSVLLVEQKKVSFIYLEMHLEGSWMTPKMKFLKKKELPCDKELKYRAARFCIIKGVLYRKGFSFLYLRCSKEGKANYVLIEKCVRSVVLTTTHGN